MERILLIFDYFKEAFNINKKNKKLYLPQMFLAVLNSFLFLLFGYLLIKVVDISVDIDYKNFDASSLLQYSSQMNIGFAFLILYFLIIIAVEAGLFNMYQKALSDGTCENDDFLSGIVKYFNNFLWIDISIVFIWFILIPIFIMIGALNSGVGFFIIPLLVNMFLSMWKISMVTDGLGIIKSFSKSIMFVFKNFGAFLVFVIIWYSFTSPVWQFNKFTTLSKSNLLDGTINKIFNDIQKSPLSIDQSLITPDGNGIEEQEKQYEIGFEENLSILNQNSSDKKPADIETDSAVATQTSGTMPEGLDIFKNKEALLEQIPTFIEKYSGYIKSSIIFVFSILALSTLITSLVKMIFKVFFQLTAFIVYKRGFSIEDAGAQEVNQ